MQCMYPLSAARPSAAPSAPAGKTVVTMLLAAHTLLLSFAPATLLNATSSWHTLSYGPDPEGIVQDDHQGLTGTMGAQGAALLLQGNTRGYLISNYKAERWSQVVYEKLDLLGKTLRWTADLSAVECGCNAALYLVAMDHPTSSSPGYCDIQSKDHACLELDLMEANQKAVQTTLHTQTGTGVDGTCNQYGCARNWGKASSKAYGAGSDHAIDSTRPFEMAASFDDEGRMTLTLAQGGGDAHTLWDVATAGNWPAGSNHSGVPAAASEAVRLAMRKGLVLVLSLWGGGDMSWLDGGCRGAYQQCQLGSAQAVVSNLRVENASRKGGAVLVEGR